jgi:hypothetical protein
MIQLTYIYTTTTVIKLAPKMIDGKVKMLVSSSISKARILWNITSSFSKDEFLLLEIKPDILLYCKSI